MCFKIIQNCFTNRDEIKNYRIASFEAELKFEGQQYILAFEGDAKRRKKQDIPCSDRLKNYMDEMNNKIARTDNNISLIDFRLNSIQAAQEIILKKLLKNEDVEQTGTIIGETLNDVARTNI